MLSVMAGRTPLAALLALLSVPAFARGAGHPECTLGGEGDVDLCQRTYLGTRLAGVALPEYSFTYDGETLAHGMVWELSFDIPREFWPEYFALGAPIEERKLNAGLGKSAFHLNFAAAVGYYPANQMLVGRLDLRTRFLSLAWPQNPALSFLHLSAGLGGFLNRDGGGPRLELRMRVGHIAWGGLVLAAAYEPNLAIDRHTGDFSIGFEAPWVWWW
jgi:hypothetical protein